MSSIFNASTFKKNHKNSLRFPSINQRRFLSHNNLNILMDPIIDSMEIKFCWSFLHEMEMNITNERLRTVDFFVAVSYFLLNYFRKKKNWFQFYRFTVRIFSEKICPPRANPKFHLFYWFFCHSFYIRKS